MEKEQIMAGIREAFQIVESLRIEGSESEKLTRIKHILGTIGNSIQAMKERKLRKEKESNPAKSLKV